MRSGGSPPPDEGEGALGLRLGFGASGGASRDSEASVRLFVMSGRPRLSYFTTSFERPLREGEARRAASAPAAAGVVVGTVKVVTVVMTVVTVVTTMVVVVVAATVKVVTVTTAVVVRRRA